MSEELKSCEERGWVIERHRNSQLEYWAGRDAESFTSKHAEAIRFAREVDGQVVLSWLLKGFGRVAEHAWRDGPDNRRAALDAAGGKGETWTAS